MLQLQESSFSLTAKASRRPGPHRSNESLTYSSVSELPLVSLSDHNRASRSLRHDGAQSAQTRAVGARTADTCPGSCCTKLSPLSQADAGSIHHNVIRHSTSRTYFVDRVPVITVAGRHACSQKSLASIENEGSAGRDSHLHKPSQQCKQRNACILLCKHLLVYHAMTVI